MEIVMKCASFTGRYQVDDRHAQGEARYRSTFIANPAGKF